MRRLFLALLLLVCLLPASAQTGQVYAGDRLSSTVITCICQDKAGYMWIGTEYGLNRFDGYRFTHYLNQSDDPASLQYNVVSSLFCDRDGHLWVGTSRGLQRYDDTTDSFVNYSFTNGYRPRVSDLLQTKDGTIFVGTSGYGLFKVVEDTDSLMLLTDYSLDEHDSYFNQIFIDGAGRFWKSGSDRLSCRMPDGTLTEIPTTYGLPTSFFEFQGKTIGVCRNGFVTFENGRQRMADIDISAVQGQGGFRTAFKDHVGNVYVGTRGNGLFWIPVGTRQLVRHPIVARGFNMATSKVWAFAEDVQGNVWLGCHHKGLLMIPNRRQQFDSWTFSGQKIDIGTYVAALCEGDDGLTWCVAQTDGVFAFDRNGHIVTHSQAPGGAECIYRDSQQNYWLGTIQGAYKYNPLTGAAQLFANEPCDVYNTMVDDNHGRLFFSTFGKGMQMYDRQNGTFRKFTMTDEDDSERGRLCNNWIMAFLADRDGRVWVATSSGVTCYDPVADTFKPFGWDIICDGSLCFSLCETREGNILLGTEQGIYVWNRSSNQVKPFPHAEQLGALAFSSIVQDNDGNIWCATSKGLWHYHADEKRWVNYVNGSGLTVSAYPNSRGMHTSDDRIFFTTNDGITTFTPQQVHSVQVTAGTVHLTNFFIGNQQVSALTESGGRRVTEQPVTDSHHFTVSYLDNSFSMEFSLLNFSNAVNTVFEYRLNNDKEWTRNSEGQNAISFSHLGSGTYELSVRAIDNGVFSEEQVYTIVVTTPWFRSTLAVIIYVLLAVLLVAFAVTLYRRRMRQQLEEDKMKFLINATHDIRSPLTIILAALKKLGGNSGGLASDAIDTIDRNAQRILSLVNQILDIRKIDKQQMHLHCRQTDMRDFISIICKVYEYNAHERNITFTFTPPAEPVEAWIDRTQFDKVLSNLLSNAFKYSFDQGEITIGLTAGHDDQERPGSPLADYVEITVTDTGTGMREDTIQHIFDRFYQEKTSKSRHIEGTGIGLNLCKMIVDMHHGTITARNRTDGVKGSVFTVRLPQGNAHLSEAEIDNSAEQPATVKMTSKRQPRSNYRVLIVDDDEEIGSYISNELGAYYYFSVCHNGKDGLRELLKNPYDLVISDVMMPEMDGFTMLRLIKTNSNISHLPVIMLTSKSDVGNRLEGLEKGADAYLTKPFDMDELHVTIDNLIANHLRLKGKFSGAQQQTDKIENIEVKGNDEQLMERIMKSINQHLSDSEFSVDQLCEEVGISRAHLHRKMKDMTGIPVSEFIRNIRLEQGARLLKEQKLNITQVAYTVGFSNLGYFSTVFRKHFGVSPREFVERQTLVLAALGLFAFGEVSAAVKPSPQHSTPLVYPVENTGTAYPAPKCPDRQDLSRIEQLTDPFLYSDGSGRALEFADWARRRSEIGHELQHYELGQKPEVTPEQVKASMNGDTLVVKVTVNGTTITLTSPIKYPSTVHSSESTVQSSESTVLCKQSEQARAQSSQFSVQSSPYSVHSSPYPVMIGMGWLGGSLPREVYDVGPIALMAFNFKQVATDSQNRGDGSGPFDELYPELKKIGTEMKWAWGVSRLIDGLQQLGPEVTHIDTEHIGVTGCSFAGKMALYCGAFDERIALTIPQEPGGGGVASWRVSHWLPMKVECIDNTNYTWFLPSLRDNFGNDDCAYLPFDQHELAAMICPRALLMLGNPDYEWLADPSAYVSMNAARKVWQQYGIEDRCGYSIVAGHGHCQLPQCQYPEVQAFIKRYLLGQQDVDTNVEIAPQSFIDTYDVTPWIPWASEQSGH